MTILEPTLYANGAIRVTRHGDRAGGTVILRTDETRFQFSVPDALTEGLVNNLEGMIADNTPVPHIWDNLIDLYQGDIIDYAPKPHDVPMERERPPRL